MLIESPRPTQTEFTDAAFRFTTPDTSYPSWLERSWVVTAMARLGCALTLRVGQMPSFQSQLGYSRRSDLKTILREQQAEGLVPGEENPKVFAIKQTKRYEQL
jgi:hypothetical protein